MAPQTPHAVMLPHVPNEARPGWLSVWRSIFLKRTFRVMLLGLTIIAMSSVDLYLTILYVTHTGMNEMNPLARAMMAYQSPFVLSIWKALTVAISVGILLLLRKQRSAELGAWAGCLVMGWLMLHWSVFISETQYMDIQIMHEVAVGDPTWVMMEVLPTGVAPYPRRTIID